MAATSYLRVKNWDKLQHYSKRRPPWIKSYARLLMDDRFVELNECERGQLMTIWLVASQASRFTMDGDKVVPVVPNDERKLRQAIRGTRKVPIQKFIKDGWLVEVDESQLVDEEIGKSVDAALALVAEMSFR